MKDIKKFEAFGDLYPESKLDFDWRKEFLHIRELFYNIEENLPDGSDPIDFSAGWRTSTNSHQYPCYINRDGKISGDDDSIDKSCGIYAKFLVRVMVDPKFKNSNYSPFKISGSQSFFGENSLTMMDIISRIRYITKDLKDYSIGITLDRESIYVYFLRDKNEK